MTSPTSTPVPQNGDDTSAMPGVKVFPWLSSRYGHTDSPEGPAFVVDMHDERVKQGRAFLDIRPAQGPLDDVLSTMVEVAEHPTTGQAVPVVRVHRADDCVVNVYVDGDNVLVVMHPKDIQDGRVRVHVDWA